MDIINNNPYRYLGVFSNSSTKERVANRAKMNAFLKVGKSIDFPMDLPNIFPSISRTMETITKAESELILPRDKIRYAQFWWMNSTHLDQIAFNHLVSGDVDMAKSIWDNKESVSSLQNRLMISAINEDWPSVIRYAEVLYDKFDKAFVKEVSGEENSISESLWKLFLDSLSDAGVELQYFVGAISNADWKNYISGKAASHIIDFISKAIEDSKATRGKDATTRLKSGNDLMLKTKSKLYQLKSLLTISDFKYQTIADKLASEILQCGIDYFNDSNDDDSPQKAGKLQNYALSIAVGKFVKDRCQENVDILNKNGKLHTIRKELEKISEYITNLRKGALLVGISTISRIVDECIPLMNSLRNKLGSNDNLYIKVSSSIVSSAVNTLVQQVNLYQSVYDKSRLNQLINDSIAVMNKLGEFDMDSDVRQYYMGNKNTLYEINNKLNPSGCYIATMVYGDYDHPQVMVLRGFRDNYLAKRAWGKQFIKFYYRYSPRLVAKLTGHNGINNMIRKILDCFIEYLKTNKI